MGTRPDETPPAPRALAADPRLRLLADAGALLGSSPDWETTLTAAARLALGTFADWAVVDVVDRANRIRRIAVEHASTEKASLAAELKRTPPGETTALREALRTGRAILAGPAETERRSRTFSPEYARIVRALGAASFVTAPLLARGHALGAVAFVRGDPRAPFTEDDLALAQELARIAALAVDNARLAAAEREARAVAEEALQLREDFLSVAGHELRTPLTAIELEISSLLRMVTQGARSERILKRGTQAARATERMARLVDQILDVSRMSAGQLAVERGELDLSALVTELVAEQAEAIARACCEVRLSVAGPVRGAWDRRRVREVVANLLDNALKYGPGKPIAIRVDTQGRTARLVISDHGIGIPPHEQARIFGRCERAVSVRHYGGLGLGLWIARQIVEAHGGRVTVRSDPGAGATFTVELPFGTPHGEASTPGATAGSVPS